MKNKISIYTEMTPNPDVMKFVSSNIIYSQSTRINLSGYDDVNNHFGFL